MIDFTDIYDCVSFVNEIKKKHIDIDDEPLDMGIFGYLGEVHANILQNSAQTAAENALEGLPTKAKYAKNLYTHAYSVGLDVKATPARLEACIILPEEQIMDNMDSQNRFILDKDYSILVPGKEDDYHFHLDYDVIIQRVTLPNKEVSYTARYDMSVTNPLSDIINPYIQSIGRFTIDGGITVIMFNVILHQVKYETHEFTTTSSNPLTNKSFYFDFKRQLATFLVQVDEGESTHWLTPIYDGLKPATNEEYINFMFLDTNTIRCIFRRESYQPRTNARVTAHIYTTNGSAGNFTYTKNLQCTLKSDRFSYRSIWMIVKPLGDSTGGEDMKTTTELRKMIPKEQLARGTVTNSRDLENFFNSINNSTRKIYFIKKLDSIERLYYSYVAIKDRDNNVIPTNTIDINVKRNNFDNIQSHNYMLYAGNCIHYTRAGEGQIVTQYLNDEDKMKTLSSTGFLYFNPFTMIVNKNPFYVSYLIDIIHCYRKLGFSYINQNSEYQFIANEIEWQRQFFSNRNTYTLTILFTPNVENRNIFIFNKQGDRIGVNFKVILVLKAPDGVTPMRYVYGTLDTNRTINTSEIYVTFTIDTDNDLDTNMNLRLKNLYDIGHNYKTDGYFASITQADIYICPMGEEGGTQEIGQLVPGLEGYSCCNKYSITNGLPLYYDYSKVISTFIDLSQGQDNTLNYYIKKVPVIRYDYVNSEDRILTVLEQLELIRNYIEYKLNTLEDGFGVDIKLFNTYGPAKFFLVDNGAYLDNVSLKLHFKTKLLSSSSESCIQDLAQFIKSYIEDFDNIGDLHIPNLQSSVTEQFREQLEYFEYLGVNSYGVTVQHIYRDAFESDITKVPEILSIHVSVDGTPDIDITISTF